MLIPFDAPAKVEMIALIRFDNAGNPFQIRDFLPSDLEALLRFYEEFEPKRAAQGLPPAEPDRIRRWLASVLGDGLHKVAMRGESLIGHGFVAPTTRAGVGEYAVFIHQDERRVGIGTQLNATMVEAARKHGLTGLWLTVEPLNRAAVRSYEKVGFAFVPGTAFAHEAEMEVKL